MKWTCIEELWTFVNLWSPKLKLQCYLVSDVRIGEAQQNSLQSSTCAKKRHGWMSRKSRLNVSVRECLLSMTLFWSGRMPLRKPLSYQNVRLDMSATTMSRISLQLLGPQDLHWASTGLIPPKIYHRFEASVINTLIYIRRASLSLHLLTGARATPGSTAVPLSLHGWMDRSSWFSRNCFDIRVLQLRNSSLKECRHPQPLKSSTKMDCRSILHRSSEQMGDPMTPNCDSPRDRSQIRIANWEGKESCTSSKEIPEIWKGGYQWFWFRLMDSVSGGQVADKRSG